MPKNMVKRHKYKTGQIKCITFNLTTFKILILYFPLITAIHFTLQIDILCSLEMKVKQSRLSPTKATTIIKILGQQTLD